jgi:hypothetical protein
MNMKFNKSLRRTDFPFNIRLSLLMALAVAGHLMEGQLRRFDISSRHRKADGFQKGRA